MESTRTLSNFDFQWTKILCQNNLKHIAFFLHFSRAKDVINHLQRHPKKFPMGARENECQMFLKLHLTHDIFRILPV